MANRSNLREGEKLELLRQKVIDALKSNETLREINTQRKNLVLKGGDDKLARDVIESFLSKNPLDKSLANLLRKGFDKLVNPSQKSNKNSKNGKNKKVPQQTKRFPSIFRVNIKENQDNKRVKSIPLGGKGIIEFETDVVEDYFYRPQEKGDFEINILRGRRKRDPEDSPPIPPKPFPVKVEDIFEVNVSGPTDGSIKLTCKPMNTCEVGDEVEVSARLTSPEGDKECIFYVRITSSQKQKKQKTKKQEDNLNLPKLIKVNKKDDVWKQDNKEDWIEEGWDENSIIKVLPDNDEDGKVVKAIAVNMDSHSWKKYLSDNKGKSKKEVEYLEGQYISKIYLHGLFLYSILEKIKQQENGEYQKQDIEDLVSQIFRDYAGLLVHLDTNREVLEAFEDSESSADQ
ncbi:MAG: hypothetical protein ACR2NQ_04175 [Thermodesulfobacteriota bacterium]